MLLFFLGEPPLQVFFFALLLLFLFGLKFGSKLLSELYELLLCYGEPAAFADIMFGGYHILHFAAALWTIRHF